MASDPLVKEKTQLIFEFIHESMSTDDFLNVYSEVKNELSEKREAKKAKTKLLAVSEPSVAIYKKIRKRMKLKLHRKFKWKK